MVPLGAIGFDGLIAVDEVNGFSELTACGGATFSGNLVVDISVVLLYDKALFAPKFLFVSTLFPYEIFDKEWLVLRLTTELGCEFKNNKARYSSCQSYFAFFKVRLTVWIDCSTKPLDW